MTNFCLIWIETLKCWLTQIQLDVLQAWIHSFCFKSLCFCSKTSRFSQKKKLFFLLKNVIWFVLFRWFLFKIVWTNKSNVRWYTILFLFLVRKNPETASMARAGILGALKMLARPFPEVVDGVNILHMNYARYMSNKTTKNGKLIGWMEQNE